MFALFVNLRYSALRLRFKLRLRLALNLKLPFLTPRLVVPQHNHWSWNSISATGR